jgi:hypothetical protein
MLKMGSFTYEGSPIEREALFDTETNKLVIRSYQPNMQDCLDMNVAWLNAERSSTKLHSASGWTKVASVPLWLIEKWKAEDGLDYFNRDHQPGLLARFNSNEYLKLRTAPGKL